VGICLAEHKPVVCGELPTEKLGILDVVVTILASEWMTYFTAEL